MIAPSLTSERPRRRTDRYSPVERAQEILDRAGEAGHFEDCVKAQVFMHDEIALEYDEGEILGRAQALLGEEFGDIDVELTGSFELVARYSPQYLFRRAA